MKPIRVLPADGPGLSRAGFRSLLQNIIGIEFALVDHQAHRARRVRVDLRQSEEEVEFAIRDDGIGFDSTPYD